MDKLKQKGLECKQSKSWLKDWEWNTPQCRTGRTKGTAHIKAKDYGKTFDLAPLTNRYVKKFKEELKREYRSVKRSEKHKLKSEIEQSILDEF
jgi:hypothetical protein